MANIAPVGDVACGVPAISRYLGVSARQCYHLCATGALPHWREGKTILARRSSLSAWAVAREAAALRRRSAARKQREPEGVAA